MRNLIGAAAVVALSLAPLAGVAHAQSGYDTGAGKSSGATTNSGEARPDANKSGGGATGGPSSKASATSGSGGSGSGTARPDADANSGKTGGMEQPAPSKASPTDTKN